MTTNAMPVATLPPGEAAAPELNARKSLVSATHLAGLSVLLNIISVPALAYIIRELGKTGYGQWTTATALVATASVLTNLGLRGLFVRGIARNPESASDALAQQLGLRLVLSILAGLVIISVCLAMRYSREVVECAIIASAGLVLTTLSTTLCDCLQGLCRISTYALANFIAGLVLTVLSVAAVYGGRGPVALSVAYLSGPLLSASLLAMYIHRRLFPFRLRLNVREAARLLIDSRHYATQQFVNAISINEESLLLPKLVGASTFGVFSGGLVLASRLTIVPDSLGSAFYPVVAQVYDRDKNQASTLVVRFILASLAICLPVVVGVSIMSGPVARILFQDNAAQCQRVICITIWSIPLLAIENVMGYSLNAVGQDKVQARRNFYAGVASLGAACVLAWRFGVEGACWSMLLRTIIKIALIAGPFASVFSPKLPTSRAVRLVACAALMAIAMKLLAEFAPQLSTVDRHPASLAAWADQLAGWGILGLCGLGLYILSLWLLGAVPVEDFRQLLGRKRRAAP